MKAVLQHSEEDCGAACLATIAQHYGRTFGINKMRELVGTGKQGTTLLSLRRGAENLGFNARPVRATPELIERLDRISLPAIIHWKGYHWVVLYAQKDNKYLIADPAVGIRKLNRQELLEGWANGVMLLLTPDETRFYQQGSDEIGGFGRFLKRVLPYSKILAEAIAINIVVGLLSLAAPLMMQILTDDVLVRGDMQLLTTVAIAVITLNIFQVAIGIVQSHLVGQYAQRLELGLILDYGYKLLRLPLSYFEARRSGEVVSRIDDIERVHNLISQIVLGLPSQLFIAVISLGIMIFYSWQLSLASLFIFMIIMGINWLFLPALRQKTRASIVLNTEIQGFLVETFRGIQILKTTQGTPQAWEEYQANFGRLANFKWSTMKLGFYSTTITTLFNSLTNIGLLWLGSYFVINRTLSIGQLLAFNGMSGNFLGFLSSVVGLVNEFITAQVVIQRLTEVLDATAEDEKDHKKPWAEITADTDIVCTNLNFHHQGRVDLLKDFSLTIPGGKVTALIGQSGCGKSTLVKLIAGLYDLQSGNIRYGIYNQQDISLECRRQQIILIPQEPHFWSRSIIDNFHFAYPSVNFEQIVRACQIAVADEFISNLPDKYQTILGEFGANISGGQKQRLAIARAIVTNPPVLILDESTGALDPALETKVLENLLAARQGQTTIMISHRPRVIERADFIVLLETGELKLTGTLNELRQLTGQHLKFLTP